MRRQQSALLHPELARVIAGLGHGQFLVVADAGLPIPSKVERIDVAIRCGLPSLAHVLAAVASELAVERAIVALEAGEGTPGGLRAVVGELLPGIPVVAVSHERLKDLVGSAVAVVRTGECTPYWNVILEAGVNFP